MDAGGINLGDVLLRRFTRVRWGRGREKEEGDLSRRERGDGSIVRSDGRSLCLGRFQVGGESSLYIILEVILKRDSFEKFNYQRRRNRIFEYI